MSKITVIGAGLAGVEAAWQASKEFEVDLYEMKPKKFSPAHSSENFAELVCSNSLKALRKGSAADGSFSGGSYDCHCRAEKLFRTHLYQ